MLRGFFSLLLTALSMLSVVPPSWGAEGLRVPPGFEVTEFADSKLANDIYTLTVDPRGRIVVAGKGYIRVLVDEDGDGVADRAIEVADSPRDGARGMLWEGDSLSVTGDGGLRRFPIGKDGRAAGPPELIRKLKTGGEHDAHAIRRGPDGWLYLLCGNNTGLDPSVTLSPASPVAKPIAGYVLRLSPDLKTTEVVAHGFRNAYDMDFNTDGELFTFDSDNERCVSLPWYEGTRFYHVVAGGFHGWLNPQHATWWRLPPYFPDVVAPVADLGRGSPTGCVCYYHEQFPEKYRGGFFLLDWTFGRIWFAPLERAGSSYRTKPEVFLRATGDNGFAPTGAVVHPKTGDLYVSIGGRGTRGAVYRIRHTAGFAKRTTEAAKPRCSPRSLDHHDDLPRQATGDDALQRRRALELLTRHRDHLDSAVLKQAALANLDHDDRLLRQAAGRLALRLDEKSRTGLLAACRSPLARLSLGLAVPSLDAVAQQELAAHVLAQRDEKREARLAAVRLIQLQLGDLVAPEHKGDVWAGYSAREPLPREGLDGVRAALRKAFPSGDVDLDRELLRTLAVLEDDDPFTLRRVAGLLSQDSDPVADIHSLIVFARLRAPRDESLTTRIATMLIALDQKITKRKLNRDSNWPFRIKELTAELVRKDATLPVAMLSHRDFGRADHALYASLPGFDHRKAAEMFLAATAKDDDYPWNASVLDLVAELPDERSLPVLRRLWGQVGLDESILTYLARKPHAEDRDRLLQGLGLPHLATVRACLTALEQLPAKNDATTLLSLVQGMRRLPEGKEEDRTREQFARYLEMLTGQKLGTKSQPWIDWFCKRHPEHAAKVQNPDGVDVAAWAKRLVALDWSKGDVERGRVVFTKASCAACHSGSLAIGPDLNGVTGRFSRDDLFTAILQPSKDVPARYRTTYIATAGGKIYQGIIIYEAVDSVILQTGPDATQRITNDQVRERRVTDVSLMPVGLIDRLSDGEIADLYAYLRSLQASPRKRRRRR
jgi:putative heme-binding domain-containing protein